MTYSVTCSWFLNPFENCHRSRAFACTSHAQQNIYAVLILKCNHRPIGFNSDRCDYKLPLLSKYFSPRRKACFIYIVELMRNLNLKVLYTNSTCSKKVVYVSSSETWIPSWSTALEILKNSVSLSELRFKKLWRKKRENVAWRRREDNFPFFSSSS